MSGTEDLVIVALKPPDTYNVFFTSDTHFGHKLMLQHRPFGSVEEMDTALIENWNRTVKESDSVYFLGDFAFAHPRRTEHILSQLNGLKYLVFGNHDKKNLRKNKKLLDFFLDCQDLMEIDVPDADVAGFGRKSGHQRVVLCHYAMATWNKMHYGSWNLHGHSHGSLTEDTRLKRLDVGVDMRARLYGKTPDNYCPFSYNEIKAYMAIKMFEPVDHHTEKGM